MTDVGSKMSGNSLDHSCYSLSFNTHGTGEVQFLGHYLYPSRSVSSNGGVLKISTLLYTVKIVRERVLTVVLPFISGTFLY